MKTKSNVLKKLMLFTAAFAFCAVLCAKPIEVKAAIAPTNVYQSDAGTGYVSVSWTNNVAVKYYEVQISNTGLTESSYVSKTKSASTGYSIYGLNAGTTYHVRVRAYNSASDVSNWVKIKVDTAPNNITTLTHTSSKQTSVTVKWNAVAGATGYAVYAVPYSYDSLGNPVKFVNTTSCTINVPKNSKYVVAVLPYRNAANASVKVGYPTSYPKQVTCVPVPTTPKAVKITDRYNTTTEFAWTPTSTYDNTDGYQLQVYYIKNGKAKKLTTKSTTSYYTNYYDVNATKLNSYAFKYRVRSYVTINNKKYYSSWSSYKTYIPGAVVKHITTTSYRATGGTLKWSKVNGAQSYTVYWKAAEDDNWKAVAKNVKGTSAYVRYSSSATYNYYYVRANKVKISSKSRKNSTSTSKILDAYRTY